MTWQELMQLAVDSFACPYCSAPAGDRCVTKSGRRATWTHGRRTWPIQNAWGAGYQDSERDLLDAAIDNPEWFARRVERHREQRAKEATP